MIPAYVPPAWRALLLETPARCWEWAGQLNPGGYGVVRTRQGWRPVHRLVWRASGRPLEAGQDLDHRRPGCQRRCVNPAHLRPLPAAVNRSRRTP